MILKIFIKYCLQSSKYNLAQAGISHAGYRSSSNTCRADCSGANVKPDVWSGNTVLCTDIHHASDLYCMHGQYNKLLILIILTLNIMCVLLITTIKYIYSVIHWFVKEIAVWDL